MKRRFLSILLALCMTTWLVPTSAFATQEKSANAAPDANVSAVSGLDDAQDMESTADDGETTDAQAFDAQSGVAGQSGDAAVVNAAVDAEGSHTHRICGDASCTDDAHAEIEWTAWESSTSLPTASGSYYLTTDVTLSDTWNVWKSTDIKLCLNGHAIIGADGKDTIIIRRAEESVTILDITDCHEGDEVGKITHNKGAKGRAIENLGTLTLWKGNITGNTGSNFSNGVAVGNYGGEFNMRGGKIFGNDGSQGCEGIVYNDEGTFTMTGGSITGNTAEYGGGVSNYGEPYASRCKFTMTGGSITGNTALTSGGGVFCRGKFELSGSVAIAGNTDKNGQDNNLYFYDWYYLKVNGDLAATSSIGISANNCDYDAVVGSTDTSAFISDDPNYALNPNGSNLKLVKLSDHSHAVCGESSCTDPSSHGSALTWTRWAYRTSLPSAAGNYSLERDVTLTDTWVVTGDVKLCLNGHTITGPDGKDAIKVEAEGSLVITDCQTGDKVGKITHNSGVKGRGIENYGTLALWNGSIQGNTAINSVSVISPGGGGVSNQGTFAMHGGQIVGNTAKNGGGVENLDSFSMSGGSITGNSTLEGGNGGGVYSDVPLGLSGDVVITGNKSGSADNNVYLEISDDSSGSSAVTIKTAEGALGSAAKVGITANNDVTDPVVVTGSTNTAVFESDDEDYMLVSNDDGNLVLTAVPAHAHRICGEDGCTDSAHGESLTWEKWKSTTSLPAVSGDYCLTDDVTLSDTWNLTGDVSINLCLNGHTITGADGQDVIHVSSTGNLTIADCQEGVGKITHKSGETGRGIYVDSNGALALWNGTITGNTTKNYGGGVYNEGTFDMRGGSVANNSAKYGGGIHNDGTLTMSGGSVTDNSATDDGNGGGVFNPGTLNLSGDVTIKDNSAEGKTNNVYLYGGKTIAVAEAGMGKGASVGITAEKPDNGPVVVTGSTDAAHFFSDDTNYVLLAADGSGLKLSKVHEHKICNDAACQDEGHDVLKWTGISSLGEIKASGNYYLTGSVTLSETWECSYNVNLCLNGHDIIGDSDYETIKVNEGASLAITDCATGDAIGKITHKSDKTGRGVWVDGGTLTLWNGSIAGNSYDGSNGGGVYNGGTFDMRGGSITGNSARGHGGGVVNRGTFTMSGGSITGNSIHNYGGGVCNFETFTMTGGSITGNSATYGGGVYNGGTLNLSGDVAITGNTAGTAANNVYVSGGETIAVAGSGMGENASVGITAAIPKISPTVVTGTTDATGFFSDDGTYTLMANDAGDGLMLGIPSLLPHKHKICGETSCADADHGDELTWEPISSLDQITADGNYYLTGNVDLASSWECEYNVNLCLNGMTITETGKADAIKVASGKSLVITECCETAGKITHSNGAKGCGIYNFGSLTLWNGSVAGNSGAREGGGVCNKDTFTMLGGSVSGNSADYGGGIYNSGTFTMRGGSIAGNAAVSDGGGVFNYYQTFDMIGGSITDNTAVGEGGGVKNFFGTLIMTGGSVTNNKASYENTDGYCGGGVYNGGTLNLSGDVAITGNTAGAVADNVFLESKKTIAVAEGGMAAGASVGITSTNPDNGRTVVTGSTNTTVFSSDDANYELVTDGSGGLKLSTKPVQISGVKLLVSNGGDEMVAGQDGAGSKVYDGQAVAYDDSAIALTPSVGTDVALSYVWQVKSGENYADITDNAAPSDAGSYRLLVTAKRGDAELGTCELPFTITAKELTITGATVAASKAYDGTIDAEVASKGELIGLVGDDKVQIAAGTASYDTKAVGAGKAITFSGFALTGDDAGNYVLAAQPSGTTAVITPRELGVTVSAENKAYDGTTDAKATVTLMESDIVTGDSVSLNSGSMKATFDTEGVGDSKTVTVIGLKLDGASAKNYKLPDTIAGTASITQSDKGSGTVALEGWIYGETAKIPTAISETNGTDNVTYLYKAKDGGDDTYTAEKPSAAGDYTVKAIFAATASYKAVDATGNFTIAKKTLTMTATAQDKAYDGNANATVVASLDKAGVVAGDDAVLDATGVNASFDNKDAGENKPVALTGEYKLSGAAADNYTLVQPIGVTGIIAPAVLTIAGATVADKTYDGTAAAKVTGVSLDGLVEGETLTFGVDYAVASAVYDGANATGDGSATKVDFSVALKDTASAKNYILASAEGSQPATIKKAKTTGYAVTDDRKPGEQGSCRVYVVPGGSAAVSVEDEGGIIDGVDLAGGFLTYSLKASAAEGRSATVKVKVTSANYEDYEISVTVRVADKEQVEIDLAGDEFTYNGQSQAPSVSVEGNKVQVSDLDVTYYDEFGQESATAPTKAGTYMMVASVPDNNGSYTGFAMCTFQIEPKALIAVALAQSKAYDGTAVADVTGVSLEGRVDGDEVIAQAISGSFDDKNVGTDKDVTVAFELLGKDAGNYTADAMLQTKASITAKELDVTAAAEDKTYDGNADADATAALTGAIAGDDVTAMVTSALFTDKNAGAGKGVTVGVALSGKDAGNYTAASTVTTTASIAAKQIFITGATVVPKTYDGTTDAVITDVAFDGLVDGEALVLGTDYGMASAKYDGANAAGDGAATKVTFSVTLANTDAAKNYALASAAGEQAATIDKAETSDYAASVEGKRGETGDCWVYVVPGGAASVSVVSDESGILDGAPSVANNTLTYSLKSSADEGQTSIVKVKVVSANYADYEIAVTIGVTAKEQVKIDLVGDGFTYNGQAQAPSVSVEGDKIEVGDLDVAYYDALGQESATAPKAAGTYLMIASVPGSNTGYTGFAACTFEIAKKNVGVKGLFVANKAYDGTTGATIAGAPSVDGAVAGDDVSLVSGVPAFTSAAAGEKIAVTFTDFSLAGDDADNYALTQPTGVTANIVAYDATGAEYTATDGGWANQDFTVAAAEGWKVSLSDAADGDWRDALTCSDEGEGSLTFYVRNDAQGYISTAVTLGYKIDKSAPTGKVEIGKDFWTEFVETVTFGLFHNDKQTVAITGGDALSGVASIEYLVSGNDLTVEQLANEKFTVYDGAFEIEPDAKLIVYARVTDVAGNATYLRSDGVVLDATAPVIAGAQDGRTYCGPVELAVTDANLDTVTLNGTPVGAGDAGAMALAAEPDAAVGVTLTVQPAAGEQTVVATDKAGNSTTLTLAVNDGHAWGDWTSNGDGTHTRTCKFDARHTETAACHGGIATCVDRAVCDDCGQPYGEVDEASHAALIHVAAKEATVTAEGNIEYWYCSACGKYFADAAGTKEIQQADTVVKKTGDLDGKKNESSSEGAGSQGAGNNAKPVGDQTIASTGDGSGLGLWLDAVLLSSAVFGIAAVSRKKKRGERDL